MTPRVVQGLLLKQRNLGESDLLVEFFTDTLGRLTAIVKGGKRSRKRFFGLLLTAHHLQLHLAPTRWSELWRLEAAELLLPHLGLRRDFRRLMAAGPVMELLYRATASHDPQPAALGLALLTLARLATARSPREMADALAIFLTRLQVEMGFGLQLSRCLQCGRPVAGQGPVRLWLQGGLLCPGCLPEAKASLVSPGLVKGLAAAQSLDLRALARLGFASGLGLEALPILAEAWRRIAGHDLPSLGLAWRILSRARAIP